MMIPTDSTPDPSLQAFFTKLEHDDRLQQQMAQLHERQPADLPESLAALCSQAGTPVTAETWRTFLDAKTTTGGISDDVLENVAGGGFAESLSAAYRKSIQRKREKEAQSSAANEPLC